MKMNRFKPLLAVLFAAVILLVLLLRFSKHEVIQSSEQPVKQPSAPATANLAGLLTRASFPKEDTEPPRSMPVIRDAVPPQAGYPDFVPGHFDGIMVSHVPLPEPRKAVPLGTPRTPPKVIENPPDKGGGTTYVFDDTWAIPLFAPPARTVSETQKKIEPSGSASK